MIPSAVLLRSTRVLVPNSGMAEATTHESPASAIPAPGGASKTAPSTTSMKEATTYGHQDTDRRQEDHHDRAPRREDRDDRPPVNHRRWLLMTALMPEPGSVLAEFYAAAEVDARYPNGLLNAARSHGVYTAHLTVRGVPVTITGMQCGMTWPEVDETGRLIYSLPLEAGAHLFIEAPGRVRVNAGGPLVTTFDAIVEQIRETP